MNQIRYIRGDATRPKTDSNAIIAHVCNDIGGWGAGFVLALSKNWPEPEAAYREWAASRDDPARGFTLGAVQLVGVSAQLWVANMIGQHGLRRKTGIPPVRYEAIDTALELLARHAVELDAGVHMPRIGCGLAGGEWPRIEPLIRRRLSDKDIPVTVYDLP